MKIIKLLAIVITLAISTYSDSQPKHQVSFGHGRWSYIYYVTGIDPFNGNYIVTSGSIACLGPSNVACQVSSTVDATVINSNLELQKSTCTTLFSAFSY